MRECDQTPPANAIAPPHWTGDATGHRRDLLEQSREQRKFRTDTTEVLQIRPDGSLATAAGHADAAVVQGDWLYLARAFTDDEGADRVLVVRTEIPRQPRPPSRSTLASTAGRSSSVGGASSCCTRK